MVVLEKTHDNARSHTARRVTEYLDEVGVWDEMRKRLRRYVSALKNSGGLRDVLVQGMGQSPAECDPKCLIQRMPRRLPAVITARGEYSLQKSLKFRLFQQKAYYTKIVHFHYF
ncbi:hypothetical protein QE152_g6731 [Popillia japonica]|uniref:Uncharacterized protein n=1 Tax=Popillia japonica TaxID=7064 RepID=A0AAW1MHE9_POPJA